ncbi:MAG: hypothetical protein PHH37_14270 [Paludibacter sp.]|nr:hypothetical protein [Paludibacter sp.]
MIIYSQKSISKWSFWRTKSKFFYCIASGLFYAACCFVGSLLIKFFIFKDADFLENSLGVASGAFMSVAGWYENERRYKNFLSRKSKG